MEYPSQVALITGAARRIGAALARALHQHQINVIVHYHHSEAEALALTAELNQIRDHSAIALKANLHAVQACKALIQKSFETWQRLDILINNASTYYPTIIGETTENQFEDLVGSNFKAPYFLSQYAKPYLAATSGCILNIGDINGIKPREDYAVYCAAKAALLSLTKSLAKSLAPAIRVNCIAPGPVLWPEGVNVVSETRKQEILAKIPMRRSATVEDVCETALFLIQQKYVNGQIVCVDGGEI